MKTIIIIQARMGSSRLPGKVLKEVLGKPLLEYQMERLKRCQKADEILIATSAAPADDVLAAFCSRHGYQCFRGSEDNVLERYYQAAAQVQADTVVRVTADCPLLDPRIVDQVISKFHNAPNHYDYVSNTLERTYPRGMDTEVFSFGTLEKTYQEARLDSQREHVTSYIYGNPDRFKLGSLTHEPNLSRHRWTVDQEEDFVLIEKILSAIYPVNPVFTMDEVLALLERYPEWNEINAGVEQKKI